MNKENENKTLHAVKDKELGQVVGGSPGFIPMYNHYMAFSLLWLFGCLMALTACSDDEKLVPPTITFESNTLSPSGSGETMTLTYQVDNAPGGFLLPEVQVDAEWVHLTDHSTLGTLTLEVEPAPFAVTVRTATVTLALPEYPNVQATCTLTQGANEEPFYIDIDEILSDRVFYAATPQSSLSDYLFLCTCISKEQAEAWGDEPQSVMAGLLERQNQWYEGVSWYDPSLSGYTRYANKPVEREVTLNLEPGHEYCVVAMAFSGSLYNEKKIQQLEYKSKVVKRYFTTPTAQEEVQPATATIQVNVRGCLADVAVSCSRDDVYVRAVNIAANRIPTLTTNIVDVWTMHRSGSSYDYMTKEQMQEGSFRKENVSPYMLENTEYAYCIRLYDKQLHALTDWVVERYATTEATTSDITFSDVKFSHDYIFRTQAEITPSNNDPYLATYISEEDLEEMSDAEDIEEALGSYLLKNGWSMIGQESVSESCPPDSKMYLLLAGAANGYRKLTTAIVRVPFQSAPVTYSTDLTLSVNWIVQIDGDAYAEEFGISLCKGMNVVAFGLNHSPEAAQYYTNIYLKGIEDSIGSPGFEEAVCYHLFSKGGYYPQLPILYFIPKDYSLKEHYLISFPADKDARKMGRPLVYLIGEIPSVTIDEYKQRLQEESAKTRMETPWNIEPVEAKIHDHWK